MARSAKSPPRPSLLGLFLLVCGGGALCIGLYLLSSLLIGATGDSVFAGLRGHAALIVVAGLMLALPGAGAAWIGWRLLTR